MEDASRTRKRDLRTPRDLPQSSSSALITWHGLTRGVRTTERIMKRSESSYLSPEKSGHTTTPRCVEKRQGAPENDNARRRTPRSVARRVLDPCRVSLWRSPQKRNVSGSCNFSRGKTDNKSEAITLARIIGETNSSNEDASSRVVVSDRRLTLPEIAKAARRWLAPEPL